VSRKSYTSAKSEHEGDVMEIEIDSEVFNAVPWRMPVAVLLDVPGISINGNSGPMWEAFRAAFSTTNDEGEIDATEYDRFYAFVRKPGRRVEADTLAQILADIYEEATGRPTTPSSS
jgi:hypothetical protein